MPLRLAATLHDIGKVAVPDRILQKPGPLTAEELAAVRCHPVVGAQIVAAHRGPRGGRPAGSPARTSTSTAPATREASPARTSPRRARILLVADAFDAMTSDRAYRRALPVDDALAELEREAGRQFDPRCVAALAAILGVPRPSDSRCGPLAFWAAAR